MYDLFEIAFSLLIQLILEQNVLNVCLSSVFSSHPPFSIILSTPCEGITAVPTGCQQYFVVRDSYEEWFGETDSSLHWTLTRLS